MWTFVRSEYFVDFFLIFQSSVIPLEVTRTYTSYLKGSLWDQLFNPRDNTYSPYLGQPYSIFLGQKSKLGVSGYVWWSWLLAIGTRKKNKIDCHNTWNLLEKPQRLVKTRIWTKPMPSQVPKLLIRPIVFFFHTKTVWDSLKNQ